MIDVRQYEQLEIDRVIPVVVLEDAADADPLAAALLAGGLRSAEVTFRTPAAAAAIEAIAERGDLLVGAGTVLTPDQVDEAVDAGARFVVSPGLGEEVARRCTERDVPYLPGAATATEIQRALELGLRTLKFFPAGQLGGPAMLRALSAPFGPARFVPTGGVTAANLADYLAVPSVFAAGGSWMVAPELIAAGNFDEITRRAAAAVSIVKGIG